MVDFLDIQVSCRIQRRTSNSARYMTRRGVISRPKAPGRKWEQYKKMIAKKNNEPDKRP